MLEIPADPILILSSHCAMNNWSGFKSSLHMFMAGMWSSWRSPINALDPKASFWMLVSSEHEMEGLAA